METAVMHGCPAPGLAPDGVCGDLGRYDLQQINASKDIQGVAGPWLRAMTAASGFASVAIGTRSRGVCKLQNAMKAEV
jgi:hypothetical protein